MVVYRPSYEQEELGSSPVALDSVGGLVNLSRDRDIENGRAERANLFI